LARELARKVYRLTKKPRFAKDYGLKRQIQDMDLSNISSNMKRTKQPTVNLKT